MHWLSQKWMWPVTYGQCTGDRAGYGDIWECVLGEEESMQGHIREEIILLW